MLARFLTRSELPYRVLAVARDIHNAGVSAVRVVWPDEQYFVDGDIEEVEVPAMQRLVVIGGVRAAVAQLRKRIEPGLAQQAFEPGDQCLDPQGLTVRCNRQALDFSAIGAFMGCKQMVLITFAKVQRPTMPDEVRHRQACQGACRCQRRW